MVAGGGGRDGTAALSEAAQLPTSEGVWSCCSLAAPDVTHQHYDGYKSVWEAQLLVEAPGGNTSRTVTPHTPTGEEKEHLYIEDKESTLIIVVVCGLLT